MGLFNLKPARDHNIENVRVVADLDKLIAEPVGFKLNGKVHVIKPITTSQFLVVCNELGKLDYLQKQITSKQDVSEEEIVERYHALFTVCSDTMTKKDLMGMTHAQRGALLQVILDSVGGRAQVEKEQTEKKNDLTALS